MVKAEKKDKTQIALYIRNNLKKISTAAGRKSFQRFFKEPILCHGVKASDVSKIGKDGFAIIKNLTKKEIYDVCELLFKSGYCEEALIASSWVYRLGNYEQKDFDVYAHWIEKYIDNWSECDTFCNHVVGSFIEKYPKCVKKLKVWAGSKNLWVRRTSAVSLIVPAKRGHFLKEVFEISDILLEDKEDMVQKGYGWLLKVASHKHQKQVFDYVVANKGKMPRTALRYAIEKMPERMRKRAMQRN